MMNALEHHDCSARVESTPGVTLGSFLSFDEQGSPLVDYEGNETGAPRTALSCVALNHRNAGCEVAIGFVNGDQRTPIVLGVIKRRQEMNSPEQPALLNPGTQDVTEKPVAGASVADLSIFQNVELLDRLAKLVECIRIDPQSGDLILQRGQARLILKENGVVRIQARSIVQVAEEDIKLYGAYIDLN